MAGSLPAWIDFYEEHRSDRFEVIAFHDDSVKSLAEMDEGLSRWARADFWGGRALPFPVLLDSTGTTLRQYGVRVFPTTLLIDPEGRLVGPINSREPAKAWDEVSEELLRRNDLPFPRSVLTGADGEGPRGGAARSWEATIRAIAEHPRYGGLVIEPQPGLAPLGKDPDSGLFEFAVVDTGAPPLRDPKTGRLRISKGTGLVLVLMPGGSFAMGAQASDEDAIGYDPGAQPNESPVHEVTLEPFFLSKYEMTQGQWKRVTGTNPSLYAMGRMLGGRRLGPTNPVENVTWTECRDVLSPLGLVLPTEAQWEYAARARTTTVWWTGADEADLDEAANLADRYLKTHGGPDVYQYELELDDGHGSHAPVGTYRQNPFGLHDTMGNVWEWCRDGYASYAVAPGEGDGLRSAESAERVGRGGGYGNPADQMRSAQRYKRPPGYRKGNLGVRPARALTKG